MWGGTGRNQQVGCTGCDEKRAALARRAVEGSEPLTQGTLSAPFRPPTVHTHTAGLPRSSGHESQN